MMKIVENNDILPSKGQTGLVKTDCFSNIVANEICVDHLQPTHTQKNMTHTIKKSSSFSLGNSNFWTSTLARYAASNDHQASVQGK